MLIGDPACNCKCYVKIYICKTEIDACYISSPWSKELVDGQGGSSSTFMVRISEGCKIVKVEKGGYGQFQTGN